MNIKLYAKCGKPIKKGRKKYCSSACAGNAPNGSRSQKLTCHTCGKEFIGQRGPLNHRKPKKRFCSKECQNIGHEKKTAVCFVCGKKLKPGEGYTPSKKQRDRPCDSCKEIGKWRRVKRGKVNKIKIQDDGWGRRERSIDIFLRWLQKTNGICGWCGKDIARGSYCSGACRERKLMTDPKHHLNMVMRISVGQCLKGKKNWRSTFDLVGN